VGTQRLLYGNNDKGRKIATVAQQENNLGAPHGRVIVINFARHFFTLK
jgi:hypothetical protein